MFHGVPSIFRTLARQGVRYDDIRIVRLEGDRTTHQDIAVFREHFGEHATLVNGLGATECGLVRQYFVNHETIVSPGDLPLGYAVTDMEVSILDEQGRQAAPGQLGEVEIRSAYLADRYLNNEDLTRSKFKTDAFGRRSYLTGDMGYLDAAGCLRLSGRRDHQVKVNGVTVNLAEVEAALCDLPFVRHGLVSQLFDRRAQGTLVAYLVASGTIKPGVDQVRQSLATRLPSHLLPARIVWIEQFPVSIDGKVDRASLPAPTRARPELETRYVAPRDDTERKLAAILQSILETEPIGIDDDLFLLGWDSLAIAQIANRVRSELGAEIKISSMLGDPTISGLARTIASLQPSRRE